MPDLRSSLETLLEQYAIDEGTLDYHGIHGFITALTICPVELTQEETFEAIFDGTPKIPDADKAKLDELLAHVVMGIDLSFNNEDEGFVLSCEEELDDHDDDALANWAIGFMVAHLLDEDSWFVQNEQEVCELILPIMLASGLFDEETEFKEIRKDTKLTEDMCSQIPEVLMELYLMFNSPEEKKTGGKGKRH
ncbi:hypothetical protein ACH42_15640 [Endozoicomonas sp. (ex Bugula neritina AB1)]|nr:hypothetical protein ACH42_15640 [Endozoicomonas sp. (ex Bugula neritina AB1)]